MASGLRETLTQYVRFKRGGGESVLLYSVVLQRPLCEDSVLTKSAKLYYILHLSGADVLKGNGVRIRIEEARRGSRGRNIFRKRHNVFSVVLFGSLPFFRS